MCSWLTKRGIASFFCKFLRQRVVYFFRNPIQQYICFPRDGAGEVALLLVKAGANLTAKNNEGKDCILS